jgi:hypothetical protein
MPLMILGLDIGGPHQFEIGFFPSIPNLITGRILLPPRSEYTIPTFVGHLYSNFIGAGPLIREQYFIY